MGNMRSYVLGLRLLSALAWLASVWATQEFLTSIGVTGGVAFSGEYAWLGLSWAWLVALLLQWAFTEIETPIWYGRHIDPMRLLVLAIDTLMNTAGIWRWASNISNSNVYQMLADMSNPAPAQQGQPAAAAIAQQEPSMVIVAGIAIAAGLILAFVPEYLKMTAHIMATRSGWARAGGQSRSKA